MPDPDRPTEIPEPELQAFTRDCLNLTARCPVVHTIPPAVSARLVADALLAVGASPVMAQWDREIPEVHRRSSAVVLSLGTPDRHRLSLLKITARSARLLGLPMVLDPVGVGASPLRLKAARGLLRGGAPLVLRGNVSEIAVLAGEPSGGGTPIDGDPEGPEEPIWDRSTPGWGPLAVGHTLLATGPVDFLWSGIRVHRGIRGHAFQGRATGMGCALSALVGAFLAVNPDRFEASLHGLWLANAAAERAAARSPGPGTFAALWVDSLAHIVENPGEAWNRYPIQGRS